MHGRENHTFNLADLASKRSDKLGLHSSIKFASSSMIASLIDGINDPQPKLVVTLCHNQRMM
jgi:hypothetical protein